MPKPIETLQNEVRDIQKQLKELITSVAELKSILSPPIMVDDANKSTKIQDSTGWFW
tara:strand:+ start:385 stop:555 length:171 start_codon:yes stop_codon:yes gene_type:complete